MSSAPGNYAPETCAGCQGTGKSADENTTFCRYCKGQGRVMVGQPSLECPHCGGSGKPPDQSMSFCRFCSGSGWSLVWKEPSK